MTPSRSHARAALAGSAGLTLSKRTPLLPPPDARPWSRPAGVPAVPVPNLLSPATQRALARKAPKTAAGRAKAAGKGLSTPEVFLGALRARGLPQPHQEYRFAHPRQFRADFCWPSEGIIVEQEGGVFTRQAHGSITGILRDIEKYNLAATLGYRVLRVIPADLCSDAFLDTLTAALAWRQS